MWWFLLFACVPTGDPFPDAISACEGDPIGEISACLVSESGTDIEVENTGTAFWTGSGLVQEVGVGACASTTTLGRFGPEQTVSWARVDVGGEIWRVGLAVPDWALSIDAGDTLGIAWDSAQGDFTEGRLVLRDGDGALLAWVVNTWPGDEGPPEVAIAPAEAATCLAEGEGWELRRFGLIAGASTTVEPGEAAAVEGWQVHNVDVASGECFDCDDGASWWARYAVTR